MKAGQARAEQRFSEGTDWLSGRQVLDSSDRPIDDDVLSAVHAYVVGSASGRLLRWKDHLQAHNTYSRTGLRTHEVARFVPGFGDTATACLLVMMHTGWNPDTAFNIDVSELEEWCDARLSDLKDRKSSARIYAYKAKTGREQSASSLTLPGCHPYQVILRQIEKTTLLRVGLQAQLDKLNSAPQLNKDEDRKRIRLLSMVKSPWLYFKDGNELEGRVGVLVVGMPLTRHLQTLGAAAIERRKRRGDSTDGLEGLLTLLPTDLRDAYASFIYKDSAFNELVVKRALDHGSIAATRHYLRQRRQIAERFAEFTKFLDIFFSEIKRFQAVDPTILFLRVRFDQISEEQRSRLADTRQRTRMGFGCLNPYDPPKDLVLNDALGLCAVHRCTLCNHAVVFQESFGPLSERAAELSFLRGCMPIDRFALSSFQTEILAIENVVEMVFHSRKSEFEAARDTHYTKLKRGEAYLFADAFDHSIGKSLA